MMNRAVQQLLMIRRRGNQARTVVWYGSKCRRSKRICPSPRCKNKKEKEKQQNSKTLAFNALGPRHHSRREPQKGTRKKGKGKGKKDHPLILFIILVIRIMVDLIIRQKGVRVIKQPPVLLRDSSLSHSSGTTTMSLRDRLCTLVLIELDPHVSVKSAGFQAGARVQGSSHRAGGDVCISLLELHRNHRQVVDVAKVTTDDGFGDLGVHVLDNDVAAYAAVEDLLDDIFGGDVCAWCPLDGCLYLMNNVRMWDLTDEKCDVIIRAGGLSIWELTRRSAT